MKSAFPHLVVAALAAVLFAPTLAAMDCPVADGHPNFCTLCGPCGEGQGGCKGDDQCADGLVCAENFGASFGLAKSADVCLTPRSLTANFTVDELGTISDPDGDFLTSQAVGINNRGQVVGTAHRLVDGIAEEGAYRYTPGEGFELFDPDGKLHTRGVAINNLGQIFGRVRPHGSNNFQDEVFVHTAGEGFDYLEIAGSPTISKHFRLTHFSDHGYVLGSLKSASPGGAFRTPIYYSFDQGWVDLAGVLPDSEHSLFSRLVDVNARGDLLLEQDLADRTDGFLLFTDGRVRRLGRPGNSGALISDLAKNGLAAGTNLQPNGPDTSQLRALVRVAGQNIDIHPRSYTESAAVKVTDKGIVGAVGAAVSASERDTLFTWDRRRERRIRVEASRNAFLAILPEESREFPIYVTSLRFNERLEAVGSVGASTQEGLFFRHFYYSAATGLVDLESFLGDDETIFGFPVDLNDRGQILLRLSDAEGEFLRKSVVLTPQH